MRGELKEDTSELDQRARRPSFGIMKAEDYARMDPIWRAVESEEEQGMNHTRQPPASNESYLPLGILGRPRPADTPTPAQTQTRASA